MMYRSFGVAVMATLLATGAWAASPTVEKAVDTNKPASQPIGVVDAKTKAQNGQKVILQGKVKDFIAGHAAFIIADSTMKSCKDNGENCPTPWDYCCEPKDVISKNTATVMLVAAQKPVKEEIKGVKGIDHLTPVAVEGTAQKDKAGNLVVYAEKIHVQK